MAIIVTEHFGGRTKGKWMSEVEKALPPYHDNNEISSVVGRYGQINFARQDDPIGFSLENYGEWGQSEIDKILTLIHAGDHVLDIGANVGAYTLAFAQQVGLEGQVIALEAQPYIANLLQKTVRDNCLSNVTVKEVAAANNPGVLFFEEPDYNGHINVGAVRLSANRQGNMVAVQAIRVDDLELECCDLIKIDVEGMACEVIDGAINLINKFHPTLVLEVNDVADGMDIYKKLQPHSYNLWLIESPAYNPQNMKNNKANFFGYATELALIAVHPLREAKNDLQAVGVEILSPDQLARLIIQSPRYGDKTPYDRNPEVLVNMLNEIHPEHEELHAQIDALQKEMNATLDEAKRLRYRNTLLEKRVEDFEVGRIKPQWVRTSLGQNIGQLQIDNAVAELDRVYKSKSWRITAPLRALTKLIQKVR